MILRKIKKILFQISLILLRMLATFMVMQRSGVVARKIKTKFGKTAILVPYSSPDCIALHRGFCKRLKHVGVDAKCFLPPNLNLDKYVFATAAGKDFLEFKLDLRQQLSSRNLDSLFYPLIDSFVRTIPYNFFFKPFVVDAGFYDELVEHVDKIKNYVKEFDICFLADTAYLNNHLIKQTILNKSGTVFYFNPNGKLLRYSEISRSEFSGYKNYHLDYFDNRSKIDDYLFKRFSGESKADLDSSRAFRVTSWNDQGRSRKVLFLHAFRDANNNTWNLEQPFDSYFEWVDFTLGIISKCNRFNEWFIKIHPSSDLYQDDFEILRGLIERHDVPLNCLHNCPPTASILRSRLPVYTNNGTIILETAANGYPSYFCGVRFQSSYGLHASTKDEWTSMLMLTPEAAQTFPTLIPEVIASARFQIFNDFFDKNIPELCASRAIGPRETFANKVFLLTEQIRSATFVRSKFNDIPTIS